MLTIYAPFNNPNSKAWEVFNGVEKTWPEKVTVKDNSIEIDPAPNSMFWGFVNNNVQLVKDHLPVPPRQGLSWDNVKSKWVRPDMAGKTITEVGGEKRIRGAGTGVHQRSVQTKRGLRRGEAGQLFRQPGQRRQKRI